MTDDVNWAEINDPSWQPDTTEQRIGVIVRLSGTCPRCHHPTAMDFSAVIPGEGLKGAKETVTIFCKCGHQHEDHPSDDFSCGAYWTTEAEL